MNIRIGVEKDKSAIISKYPHTRQVLGEDGYVVLAEENENIENLSFEDALEFIEYNTLRALSYMGEDAPIILYTK